MINIESQYMPVLCVVECKLLKYKPSHTSCSGVRSPMFCHYARALFETLMLAEAGAEIGVFQHNISSL